MSVRDLCDVSYVLQVELVERVALALLASSLDDDSIDLVERLRAEFDAALTAEAPQPPPTQVGGRLSPLSSLLDDLGVA